MSKKKRDRDTISGRMHNAAESALSNAVEIELVDTESFEEGKDPDYDNWKNIEQGRRMKRELRRVQKEEKDNYQKIIKKQDELIECCFTYLDDAEKAFYEMKASYEKTIGEYRAKYIEYERRISAIETRLAELTREVNQNTERLNALIQELNDERARISKLAEKACEQVIKEYNSTAKERICSKFCYYKLQGLERIISRFSEARLTADALYALAVEALGYLAEIKSLSELEWQKFHPQYQTFKNEASGFVETLETQRNITLDDNETIIELDFWTDNCFSALSENAGQLLQRVSSGEFAKDYLLSDISLDRSILEDLKESLSKLTEHAKQRAQRAFYRQSLALETSKCVYGSSFITRTCQFEEMDQRGTFVVEAEREIDDIKITLIFTPDGRDEDALFIIRSKRYIDRNKFDRIAKEITSMIKDGCGVRCITGSRNTGIPHLDYDEKAIDENGELNRTINNIIQNTNIK